MFFFFFSSRRRHTRCYRDWSSDVCSSDLPAPRRRSRPATTCRCQGTGSRGSSPEGPHERSLQSQECRSARRAEAGPRVEDRWGGLERDGRVALKSLRHMEPGVRIAFELTGEHPTLPRADALAALEAERVTIRRVSFSPTLLIVDAVRPPLRALRRVAMSRYVETLVAYGPWMRILQGAERFDLHGRRFRVRAHGPFEPAEKAFLERQIGGLLGRQGT